MKGFVDGVRARQERSRAVEMSQDPVFLEPADVAHLPDRRLEEVRALPQHLRVAEAVQHLELDLARVEKRVDEAVGEAIGGL